MKRARFQGWGRAAAAVEQPNAYDNYPVLIDALRSLNTKSFIIDGEIAALDSEGRSSFQLLQSYGISKRTPLVYYAFDLLFLGGADLRSRPLVERPIGNFRRIKLALALFRSRAYQIVMETIQVRALAASKAKKQTGAVRIFFGLACSRPSRHRSSVLRDLSFGSFNAQQ